MSELTVRRSITSDAHYFVDLIERIDKLLISRYGRTDLSVLLEESCLSLTVLFEGDPVAIGCFSYPSQETFYSYRKLKLSFFAAESQHQNEAARILLRSVFESQPSIDSVLTVITETSPLETPLVPFFSKEGVYTLCSRETVLPPLRIRAARVEDYDDLMPLFESEAPDLLEQNGPYFVSDLLMSPENKCLVAEGHNGLATGFVCLQPNFDPGEHQHSYDLEAFQDLFKQKGIAFRIRLFFMSEEYRIHSRDFMKPIFSLMRDADYCMLFLPTNCPPFPLAQFFTRIPSTQHGNEKFILYICHRDSVSDVMLNVRHFTEEDYSLLENFIEPLSFRNKILEACNDTPNLVFQLMTNEIISGICVFAPPENIDYKKWDLEEYVDVKNCHSHCKLYIATVSPIFQRFFSFFLIRCMELLNLQAIYMMHKDGKFPDLFGRTFLAIERRQGPANPEMKLHIEQEDSLHLFPMKFSLQPKFEINTSITIVGSTEGISSFLYKLVSVPYLHFSALHVVCTGGAQRVWVNTAACREYSPDWLKHLHLLNSATFFESDLVSIIREDNQIILDDQTTLTYDYLILLTAKEGEIADMWMAKNFVEKTQPPVSVVGDSLVAYYILSHYPGCAHIAHNPRFKLEGTLATIIRDSSVAYCDFKEVPPKLLSILEESSLVYDGGIVIDELFRTNDPKIFASGPITMFSRLYRLKDDNRIISQTEYGHQVASVILKFVDPLEKFEEPPLIVGSDDAKALIDSKINHSIPEFSTRRSEMYYLPGNRIFFRNGYPSNKCRCLETNKNSRTIRFYIDSSKFIQAFEYLGEMSGNVFNWMKFIGLPSDLLNNMFERYEKKMINDFAEYFSEPWCSAILHDRFRKFFDNLQEKIIETGNPESPEVQNMIREELMNFLIDNADLLPDYYTSEDQLPPLD